MGGTMGKVKDVFTGNGDQIGESGFTVGDMKDRGYDKAQIADMGATNPTAGTKLARGIIKGVGSGVGGALQRQGGAQPQGTNAAPITAPQQPQLQPQDPNYLAAYLQKRPAPNQGNPYFYGG